MVETKPNNINQENLGDTDTVPTIYTSETDVNKQIHELLQAMARRQMGIDEHNGSTEINIDEMSVESMQTVLADLGDVIEASSHENLSK